MGTCCINSFIDTCQAGTVTKRIRCPSSTYPPIPVFVRFLKRWSDLKYWPFDHSTCTIR